MNEIQYKPVSQLAVIALVISVCSLGGLLVLPLCGLGIIGVGVAMASFRSIRSFEQSGKSLARAAVAIGMLALLAAPALDHYWYASEAAWGAVRIHLGNEKIGTQHSFDRLSGQRICIKGYFLFPDEKASSQRLLFSADGDNDKAEMSITIPLEHGDFIYEPVAITGTLKVNPEAEDPRERYVLVPESVRRSATRQDLKERAPSKYGSC